MHGNKDQPAKPIRRARMAWIGAVGAGLVAISAGTVGPPARAAGPDAKPYEEQVRPFLDRYCVECHGAEKPKKGLRLDRLSPDFADPAGHATWQAVLKRVQAGEMPPEEKPQPPAEVVQVLTAWVNGQIATRAAEGRVVLRRLNRVEYENTVRDLLGIKVNLKEQLPEDGSANGFDNVGAALHTSSFLMEKYLEAADTALNMAIANRPKPPPSIKKRYQPQGRAPGQDDHARTSIASWTTAWFASARREWHNVAIDPVLPADGGNYRFRISASGFQSAGKPVTFRVTAGRTRLTGKSGLVGYFDAPPDKPTVFEFVRYMEPRTTISMLPYGLAGSQHGPQGRRREVGGTGPGGSMHRGRRAAERRWPPESHRRIFGDLAQKTSPEYNYGDRVEVVSDEPIGRCRANPRRLHAPGVSPRR